MPRYDPATALVIVDLQNDFADPEGGLAVAGGDAIVATVNGAVNIEVRVDNAKDLSSATLSIAFDSTVLTLKGVVEGEFMKKDGKNVSLVSSSPPNGGTVDVQISRVTDEKGISGSGTLFTLTFEGQRAGASSRVDFRNVRLLNPSRGPINADIFPGLINVR